MLGDYSLGDAPLGDEGGGAPPATSYFVYPIGIASEESFGSPVVTKFWPVVASGIASLEAFGSPQVSPNYPIAHMAGSDFSGFGSPVLWHYVRPSGFVAVNRGVRVFASGFSSVDSLLGMIYGEFISVGSMRLEVLGEFSMRCREAVQLAFESRGEMFNNPIGSFTMTSMIAERVLFGFDMKSAIMAIDPIEYCFRSVGVIEPELSTEVLSATNLQLIANGIEILLSSVQISISEDTPAIEAVAILRNVGDFSSLGMAQNATLTVAGEAYELVIVETSVQQSDGDIQAGIRLSSPVALLALNDRLVTKTWGPIAASEAFEELVTPLSVDWGIDDWDLPDKRLSLTDVTALDGAITIAAAAGAIIQSNQDGSLRVQYRYAPPVEEYEDAVVLYSYDSIDEVFSLSETVSLGLVVNKLRIMDVSPSTFADKIEYDEPSGRLLVFPSPWRENLIVTHTSLGSVILTPTGVKDLDKEELVLEFKEGTAEVKYPIWSIVSVEWLGEDLGGLTFPVFGTTFTSTNLTKKYSIAKVVYRTKAMEWKVSTTERVVQFLVED